MTIKHHDEVPVELNDIRTSLNKISDTGLALDILSSFEKLDVFTKKQKEALEDATKEAIRLREVNQSLLLRVTSTNTGVQTGLGNPSNSQANLNKVDPLNDIISRI